MMAHAATKISASGGQLGLTSLCLSYALLA